MASEQDSPQAHSQQSGQPDQSGQPSREPTADPGVGGEDSFVRGTEAEQAPQPEHPLPNPLLVAVAGEMAFCGSGVVQALLDLGFRVRAVVANQDERERLEADIVKAGNTRSSAGAFTSTEQALVGGNLEIKVSGIAGRADIESICEAADGLVLLSPIGIQGRQWGRDGHIDTVKEILSVIGARSDFGFVYLSSLAVDGQSRAKCLQEALACEKLILEPSSKGYILRSGPLAGRGDGFLTRIADQASTPFPTTVIWGYGDTTVQPLHVYDFGRCVARCFQTTPVKLEKAVYAVGGPQSVTLLELLDNTLFRMGRFKIKFHIPLFCLRLMALFSGAGDFREKVNLLSAPFFAPKTDIAKFLGPHHGIKTLDQLQNEVIGIR